MALLTCKIKGAKILARDKGMPPYINVALYTSRSDSV